MGGDGEKLPTPTWMTAAELAPYEREMATLAADPRTAGSANRPAWLVRRVLSEKAGRC